MKEFQDILDGLRQTTSKAEFLINSIQDHKDMLTQIKDNLLFGAPFTVKFYNDKEFMFPNNYNLSIFKNICESALEIEIERMTKELEDILCFTVQK
jgi:hypothetical protein